MLDYGQVAAFLLVFTRVGAFLGAGPLFWLPGVPSLVKIGISLVVAVVLFPVIPVPGPDFPGGLPDFGLCVAEEAGIGLLLGFVCNLVFRVLTIAGQLMDIQIGFFMSIIFDPASGAQATITSRFLSLLGMVLFLTLNGHHILIAGLNRSYELVPLMSAVLKGITVESVIRIFTQMVSLAVQIAAPIIAVILIVDVCLGLLSRTAPEMNIFMLGFPVKIGMGIFILTILIPLMGVVFRSMIKIMERDLYTIMKALS